MTAPAPVSFGPLTESDFLGHRAAARHPGMLESRVATEEFTVAAAPLAAGLLASFATGWLGADTVRRFRTRCTRALWPGDTLTCSGYVVQRYVEDGEDRVDVALTGLDQEGEVVIRAWASFAARWARPGGRHPACPKCLGAQLRACASSWSDHPASWAIT
ncbi:hypothetical protein [Nocardia farcinica]